MDNVSVEQIKDKSFEPMSLREQIIYALSEFAGNPLYTVVASFLTFFYTDVIGVNPGSVGLVILLSKFLDGISDVAMGNIIDHTHTKAGNTRPWFLRAAFPLVVAFIALFTVPNVPEIGKLVYIFVTYNFSLTVVYTVVACTLVALPTYATADSKSRSTAHAIRLFLAGTIQMFLAFFFLRIIEALGGDQTAWIKFAAILGIIGFAACFVVYFGTKERVILVHKKGEKLPLTKALWSLLKNKYWLIIVGIVFLYILHQVTTLTIGIYYAKYILGDQNMTGNLILYHHIPAIATCFIIPFIIQIGIPKGKIAMGATLLMLLGAVMLVFSNESIVLIVSLGLRGIGFGAINGVYVGMCADTITYGEWKTGVKALAINTSAVTVSQKVGAGVGTALFGGMLAMAGYNGLAEVQSPSALTAIRICFVYVPIALYILQAVLLLAYKLDKEYPAILKELEQRHQAEA
ncbi:MAG: glycoside-pentoside-hexuronide (GPH):cation symporter [Treponema sp.]|jgi:GPH family glycoside/pentoside/hexuronide:cation symporter|nr:glycoside-pentoside-hexuronide (GPH):cation symporter [Treponema sp.]